MKIREGRGFTLEEIKAAGIREKEALSIGVAVDHRAKSRSEERFNRNVERLQAYKARLVVFPKNSKKPKKGDASVSLTRHDIRFHGRKMTCPTTFADFACPSPSLQGDALSAEKTTNLSTAFPLPAYEAEKPRAITAEEKEFSAYTTLRKERSDARLVGVREKRAKAKEEAEAAKAGK